MSLLPSQADNMEETTATCSSQGWNVCGDVGSDVP